MENEMALVLSGIRKRFLDTLGHRLADLDRMNEVFQSDPASIEGLTFVRSEAHKFRGLAATIGFSELGQVAAATEEQATRAMAGGPTDPFRNSFGAMLDEIEHILCETDDNPRMGLNEINTAGNHQPSQGFA